MEISPRSDLFLSQHLLLPLETAPFSPQGLHLPSPYCPSDNPLPSFMLLVIRVQPACCWLSLCCDTAGPCGPWGGRGPGLSACPEGARSSRGGSYGFIVRRQSSPFPVCEVCHLRICPAHLLSFRACEAWTSVLHTCDLIASPGGTELELTFRLKNLRHRKVFQGDPECKRRPTDWKSRLIRAASPCSLAAGFILGRHDLSVILAS